MWRATHREPDGRGISGRRSQHVVLQFCVAMDNRDRPGDVVPEMRENSGTDSRLHCATWLGWTVAVVHG